MNVAPSTFLPPSTFTTRSDPPVSSRLIHEHEWIKVNTKMLCLNNALNIQRTVRDSGSD